MFLFVFVITAGPSTAGKDHVQSTVQRGNKEENMAESVKVLPDLLFINHLATLELHQVSILLV